MRTFSAKPVFYNGIHFRSTEEARWAAFFDRLSIRFEYEKPIEALYYLPDFHVPSQARFPNEMYFEVKPVPDEAEEEKCAMLSVQKNVPVGILRKINRPTDDDFSDWYETYSQHECYSGRAYEGLDGNVTPGWDIYYAFCQCSSCGAFGFEFNGRSDRICHHPDLRERDHGYNCHSTDLRVAYMHAMTLKF